MRPSVHRASRRLFLEGMGAAAGAATLLRPRLAEAEGILPQRFLYIHYPLGTVSGLPGEGENAKWFWFPKMGSGPNYTPSALLEPYDAVKGPILPMDGMDLGDPDHHTSFDHDCAGMMYM